MSDEEQQQVVVEESFGEVAIDSHKKEVHYPPEIVEKAKDLSFFQVDPPRNVIEGISGSEYNLLKGAVTGSLMMVTAPFTGAYDEASKGKDAWEVTSGVVTGFANGLVRGVAGGSAVIVTGAITGLNQLRTGFQEAPDAPGQGSGIKENFEHVLSTPYTHLVSNTESESFQSHLQRLIDEGKLPARRFDVEGREIPYTYQFFLTEEPTDFVDGLNGLQYNAGKGLIAGATLAVSAPVLDTIAGFNRTDEKGEKGGFEGAVTGLGSGLARGFVGGFMLAGAGVVYGSAQVFKGFVSLHNIPKGQQALEKGVHDFERLVKDPVYNLVLQKGFGLEEFIIKEEERKRLEEEEKARVEAERLRLEEEKRVWYLEHPGEVHPSDATAAPPAAPAAAPEVSAPEEVAAPAPAPAPAPVVIAVGGGQFDKNPIHGDAEDPEQVGAQ